MEYVVHVGNSIPHNYMFTIHNTQVKMQSTLSFRVFTHISHTLSRSECDTLMTLLLRDTARFALYGDGHPLTAAVVLDACCARECDRRKE